MIFKAKESELFLSKKTYDEKNEREGVQGEVTKVYFSQAGVRCEV